MALYSYQALGKDGKKIRGTIDAVSPQAVRDNLTKMGLYPIKIEVYVAGSIFQWSFRSFFRRSISLKDKIFFTKQMALLLKSGVPLVQALELLVEQSDRKLRPIIIKLKDDIKEGTSLAGALEKYPAIFDATYVQLVRAGEASGNLDVILHRLSIYLERRQEITKRVKGALSYPLFQLVILIGIVSLLLIFVVPQIATTFEGQKAELPGPTRFLMGLSRFIRNYYLLLIAAIILVYIGYRWFKATTIGRRFIDTAKLKLPLIGYFARMGTIVQFCRTLGMLVESGVNLAEALFIVCNIVENKQLTDTLMEARDNIIKQGRIAEYLKKTELFPPLAIYLIHTGEQSGNLGPMLITVAEYYERELTELSDSLSSKLGPIMTLVMAVLVGFIVISIVMPLVQSAELVGV